MRPSFPIPGSEPDFLKIYPTLVTPGSEIEELWELRRYAPYDEDELIDLIAYAKTLIPEYTRLSRVQRDIPAKLIVAGSRHSNFRQLAQNRLAAQGRHCRCIRCREIGRLPSAIEAEHAGDQVRVLRRHGTFYLRGLGRLRSSGLPGSGSLRLSSAPSFTAPRFSASLHVYGSLVPVGLDAAEAEEWQHRNFGKMLLSRAEEIAKAAGFGRVAIMSGIGVRPYYRRQGYERRGPYMVKEMP